MKLKEILTSAIIMLALDFVYLGSFKNYFQSVFKNIQGKEINSVSYTHLTLPTILLV